MTTESICVPPVIAALGIGTLLAMIYFAIVLTKDYIEEKIEMWKWRNRS